MAERLGEGYIEIFGMDARFNESLRQVQRNMAATTKMVAAGQRAMGLGPQGSLPARDVMGRFTAGAGFTRPDQHPFFSNRNLKGQFIPGMGGAGGAGGIAGAATSQIDSVSAAYKGLMGLYAAKVAGGVFVDAVKRGSDMIETVQKTKVVFGAATATVTNMADEMAKKYGSNKQVMLDTASQFGLIGQAAHLSQGQSAGMAVAMTRLAADASSFYNVPLDVALQKIQAGLVGQSRPLREFGVLLNIGTVNAKAAEMGFKALHGQFTEGEKVMARMQLITEGLSKATGDLGKTIDSPANAMRRLTGEWENFKTEQGAPVAVAGAGMLKTVRTDATQAYTYVKKLTGSEALANLGGAYAGMMSAMREGFRPDEDTLNKMMGVDSKENVEPIIKANETAMEKFYRERQQYDDFMQAKEFREKQFHGGGFGAGGMMGNIGQMMSFAAMRGETGLDPTSMIEMTKELRLQDLNKQIRSIEKHQDAWGGGHVTDPLSFMRQAQEKILTPMDDTAKEQLAELKAIREALESRAEGVGNWAIVKGRES